MSPSSTSNSSAKSESGTVPYLSVFLLVFTLLYHGAWFFARDWSGSHRDPGSNFISGVGSIVRYRLGQLTQLAYARPDADLAEYFLRSEVVFQYQSKARLLQTKLRPALETFVNGMAARGVQVYLLPLPTKFSIERESYGARLPSSNVFHEDVELGDVEDPEAVYFVFRDLPHHASVELYSVLKSVFQAGERTHLPWDYHLSSRGIATVAKAAADHLHAAVGSSLTTQVQDHGLIPEKDGQFLGHLRLPTWYLNREPAFAWQENAFTLVPAPLPKSHGTYHYFGSSQSRRLRERAGNIPSLLAAALQIPLQENLVDDVRLSSTLEVFVAAGKSLSAGDTLIWEVPVGNARFFPDTLPLLTVTGGPPPEKGIQ